MKKEYQPESYWTEVGERIEKREDGENVLAGDDEPFYRYKRNRFLEMLGTIDFSGKNVLEIGSGPGGNLVEIWKKQPAKLTGVDISQQMVNLARKKVSEEVEIIKIDGRKLPFPERTFDIVFTATVLQHNTDEEMLLQLMEELSRVSADKVYLFERVEKEIKGDELNLGRPVSYYAEIMKGQGFHLLSEENINIRVSYYVSGVIRKLLNPKTRKEGEPLNSLSTGLQKLTLPITKPLDKILKSGYDLTKLEFSRRR